VFDEGVIGPLTAPGEQAHNMSGGHGDYNRAVRKLWDDYLKETSIDPNKITKGEAEEFLSRIRRCPDPDVRNFNRRQYARQLNYYMRRWLPPIRSGE
jgi:hypothetical protein